MPYLSILHIADEHKYGQTVWPTSTLDDRREGSCARLPWTLLTDGVWFILAVTPAGLPVAYTQWTLAVPLWERLRSEHSGGMQAQTEDAMRAKSKAEHAASCEAQGELLGMRLEVVEACTPAMEEAGERVFPPLGSEKVGASSLFIACSFIDA